MADSAKTGENARWRSRTARAHPIFDICDLTLRSNFLKFQILSPLLPLNLWLNFENLTHCPFNPPAPTAVTNIPPTMEDLEIMCDLPRMEEVKIAIGMLKNNKAAGPDNIPAEVIKTDVQLAAEHFLPLIHKI